MSARMISCSRRFFRRYGLLLLLMAALICGCVCALPLSSDANRSLERADVLNALTSVRAAAVSALIYFVCFLTCGLSVRLYGVCLFCLGLLSGVCAQLLCGCFGAQSALLILWIFLPRLLLLCFCSVRLYEARPNAIALCAFLTFLVFALQLLLYPIFLAPGYIS